MQRGCATSVSSLRIRNAGSYIRAVQQTAAAGETIKRPLGVTVIGALYLLQGILLTVAGPLFVVKSFVKPSRDGELLVGLAATAVGVLVLLLARGLFQLRSWARKVVLWLNGIGVVLSIISFSPGSVVSILISGSILLYLGRSSMLGYFE